MSASIIAIGVAMITFCSVIYKNAKLDELKNWGDLFVSSVNREMEQTGDDTITAAERVKRSFNAKLGTRIVLYDISGKCILSDTADSNEKSLSNSLLSRLSEAVATDGYFINLETDGFAASEPQMIYGCYIQNTQNPNWSYVVLYGDTSGINQFTIYLIAAYLVLSLAFIGAYYLAMNSMTMRGVRSENEMMRISSQFAKGDFSEQIPTDLGGNMGEIAACVNAIAANVEKSEETSKTFIANVSHELRTPITTIGGFVNGILDGTIKKARQQEYLIIVSNEIKRLRILISSMLNMTRFESGTMKPNFKETNLTDLVIQVVLMFEKRIEEKHLNVEELDSNRLTAIVDADLMQQVIYNLVENAVKFVNEGGTLSFRFEKKDDICIVGIKNTGEGLKNDEIQQVFDRFYKTDSSRGKDTTGLGLGLSISRKIVHLHKGHIVVKSVYGEYTEFQIQIPENPETADLQDSPKV